MTVAMVSGSTRSKQWLRQHWRSASSGAAKTASDAHRAGARSTRRAGRAYTHEEASTIAGVAAPASPGPVGEGVRGVFVCGADVVNCGVEGSEVIAMSREAVCGHIPANTDCSVQRSLVRTSVGEQVDQAV